MRKTALHLAALLRSGPLAQFPIPCRLPYGGWYISYGDEIGIWILSRSFGIANYEEGEWRFVKRYVSAGMTCVDIGANQGFFTILLSQSVGVQGHIVAFEPTHSVRNRLRHNLALNGLSNVVVEPFAVGRTVGSATFYVSLQGKESYSSFQPAAVDAKRTVIEVPVVTLDTYTTTNRFSRLDFVKMDAEGAELDILRGGEQVFTTLRPVVLAEINDVRTMAFGYTAVEIYQFLQEREYSWYQMDDAGYLTLSPKRSQYDASEFLNLVSIPDEKIERLRHLLRP